MKFEIKNRWTGEVQFTAEIDCADDAPSSVKLGLAVRWGAYLARADLAGANLADADLAGANLARANLAGANLAGASLARANLAGANDIADRIIDGPLRSDGWRFRLTRTEPGPWRVKAGTCRNFTLPEAREHWTRTRGGTPLGEETFSILDRMETEANARGWPSEGEVRPDEKTEAA